MTDHEEVIAGCDAFSNGFFEAVVVEDRAHVEIVGHNHAIETHLFAQEAADKSWRKRSGQAAGIKPREIDMRDHHAIDLADELAEDGQFIALQLFA